MPSLNKVILIGHLGADPESRSFPDGSQVANATLATSESWKDKTTGERQEKTEWHRLVFFRKAAEIAGQYLRKGAMIYVEGKLQTRKWQDAQGVERYTTEIVVSDFKMLDRKTDNATSRTDSKPSQPTPPQQGKAVDFNDDIPF